MEIVEIVSAPIEPVPFPTLLAVIETLPGVVIVPLTVAVPTVVMEIALLEPAAVIAPVLKLPAVLMVIGPFAVVALIVLPTVLELPNVMLPATVEASIALVVTATTPLVVRLEGVEAVKFPTVEVPRTKLPDAAYTETLLPVSCTEPPLNVSLGTVVVAVAVVPVLALKVSVGALVKPEPLLPTGAVIAVTMPPPLAVAVAATVLPDTLKPTVGVLV
jgi:hypothetical protein